ncbi:hypothetical protein [Marinobacterium jannaschii]|uniref:hypothetical protein n=1 Tax=Marinobacterium jannaschii TaxID=64970 RepID=UPI000489ED1F|nr:hypothetical protein [Marinobacterium jannaschii]
MDIFIANDSSYGEIVGTLRNCGAKDALCCSSEAVFALAKKALVNEKLTGITVQLLDSEGYAIRQVTSKKRGDKPPSDQLSDRQIAVVRTLEKVLYHCQKEGIQLVGYSDELVAMPAGLAAEDLSTAGIRDVETYGTYVGADALVQEVEVGTDP